MVCGHCIKVIAMRVTVKEIVEIATHAHCFVKKVYITDMIMYSKEIMQVYGEKQIYIYKLSWRGIVEVMQYLSVQNGLVGDGVKGSGQIEVTEQSMIVLKKFILMQLLEKSIKGITAYRWGPWSITL